MPKFDSLRVTRTGYKTKERDAELIQFVKEHPNYSQKEIGKEFGISKQMVSRIEQRWRRENWRTTIINLPDVVDPIEYK